MATKTKPDPLPNMVEPPLMDEDSSQGPRLEDEADRAADEADIDAAIASLEFSTKGTLEFPVKGLHAKIAEVIMEVQYIQKTGTAPAAMGGYSFVEAGQIAAKLRLALASRGVTMLPEYIEQVDLRPSLSGKMLIQTIKTTWRLTDAESGETTTIQSMGTGGDSGDKFSPKAQTNAMKYALQVGFLLETGDDPEKFDLSEPIAGPGIQISGSNIEGVKQGGRQGKATEPQLDAIRKRAGQLQLEPEALALLIGAALGGKAPDLSSEEPNDYKTTIISFLSELSFDEAASVVRAVNDVPDAP